jgi:hypothetical protein
MADVPRHWIAPLLLGTLALGGGGGVATYSLAERVATLEAQQIDAQRVATLEAQQVDVRRQLEDIKSIDIGGRLTRIETLLEVVIDHMGIKDRQN